MYLLETATCRLVNVERDLKATPVYAILSHRWGADEITFKQLNPIVPNDASLSSNEARWSAAKIRNACAVANHHRLSYLWIDSCCIDKSSSEELREALNSMFAYYHNAAICYTYLSDVSRSSTGDGIFRSDLQDQRMGGDSEWFQRGWTLQELLAPRKMVFFDKNWQPIGTRNDLAAIVGNAANINSGYLTDAASERLSFREASAATKMSWMAGRVTTRPEDIAYSLLGIFDVNMVPQYGEGIKAFARLQDILLNDSASFDESLFAWALPANGELRCYRKKVQSGTPPKITESVPRIEQSKWGLLAPSPDCFAASGDLAIVRRNVVPRLAGGFQRTHQGVSLHLPLKETKKTFTGLDKKEISLTLNCWKNDEAVVVDLLRDSGGTWWRAQSDRVVAKKGAKVASNRVAGIDQGTAFLATITVAESQVQLRYPV